MTGDYEGPERRGAVGDRRADADGRRDEDGPTPGAQKILDWHGRQLRFGLYVCGALFFLLLALGTVGALVIDDAFDQLEGEREARTGAAASILDFGCQTDNAQDTLLADLIEVSLDGGTFGGSIDPDDLTPDELAIVTAIAHVQQLAASAPPTPQQRTFEKKLKELRDLTPCTALVNSFIEGESFPLPEPDTTSATTPTPDRVLGE